MGCLTCELPECDEQNPLCPFFVEKNNYRKKWLKTEKGQAYLKRSNEFMKKWKKEWRRTPSGKASEARSRKKLFDRGYYREWYKKNPDKVKVQNKKYYEKNKLIILKKLKEKRTKIKKDK